MSISVISGQKNSLGGNWQLVEKNMVDLIYKEESYKIIGAAMEVHRELGNGFLEVVYQEALALEFEEQNIQFEKEKEIEIYY